MTGKTVFAITVADDGTAEVKCWVDGKQRDLSPTRKGYSLVVESDESGRIDSAHLFADLAYRLDADGFNAFPR